MRYQPGQRVIVSFPGFEPPQEIAKIVAGPQFRKGMTVFKVRTIGAEGADIWVPAEWIKPLLRAVDE